MVEKVALWTEQSGDAELIAGVRAGEAAAFGVLYERHGSAAKRVASMYSSAPSDVDDIVSEAFARVLKALQQGSGPDLAFRAYLFTVVRRTGLDMIDKGKRTRPNEDMESFDAALGYDPGSDEPTLDNFEQGVVAEAFKSLPERWQVVLWYTEIEKKTPAEVAPVLGLSANGVAALAYRAREALRQAYLQQHLATAEDVDCLEVSEQLGGFVRGGLTKREHAKVASHVETCERCTQLVAELEDVNRGLRAVIAPLVLGVVGMAALEGELPILGAGANALVSSNVAGTASAASVASGAAGAAGGGITGILAAVGANGPAILTGTAATIGVGALTLASVGVIANLDAIDPAGDGNPDPVVNEVSLPGPASDSVVTIILGGGAVTIPPAEGPDAPETDPRLPVLPLTVDPPEEPLEQPGNDAAGQASGGASSGNSGSGSGSGGDTSTEDSGSGESDSDTEGSGSESTATIEELQFLNASIGAFDFVEFDPSAPMLTLSVANNGTSDASASTITVTLPESVVFTDVDGTFGVWTCDISDDATAAVCAIDTIPAESTSNLTFSVSTPANLAADAAITVTFSNEAGSADPVSVPTAVRNTNLDLDLLFYGNGNFATAVAGAPLLWCGADDNGCRLAMNFVGNAVMPEHNNDAWLLQPLNSAGGTTVSEATELEIPAGATIRAAWVEWSAASSIDEGFAGALGDAAILPPGAAAFQAITANETQTINDDKGHTYYHSRADITDLVAANGAGTWALADIALPASYTDANPNYLAGYAISVVYELASLPESTITAYGGLDAVWDGTSVSANVNGGAGASVDVTTVMWDGDRGTQADSVSLGDTTLRTVNWNGVTVTAGDVANAATSTAIGSAWANSLGTDAKYFDTAPIGAGIHSLSFGSSGDNYLVSLIMFSVHHD